VERASSVQLLRPGNGNGILEPGEDATVWVKLPRVWTRLTRVIGVARRCISTRHGSLRWATSRRKNSGSGLALKTARVSLNFLETYLWDGDPCRLDCDRGVSISRRTFGTERNRCSRLTNCTSTICSHGHGRRERAFQRHQACIAGLRKSRGSGRESELIWNQRLDTR